MEYISPPITYHWEVKVDSRRYLKKIEVDGHTYIHLKNIWNSSGDNFLHDPGCKCFQKEKNEG